MRLSLNLVLEALGLMLSIEFEKDPQAEEFLPEDDDGEPLRVVA